MQTVSNVLNAPHRVRPETAQRVRDAIEALGYRVSQAARQMRTGRSRLIAVRIETSYDGIHGSVQDRFLHGLAEAAAPAQYRVMVYTAGDVDAEIPIYEDLLAAYELDAFVLTNTHHGDPRTKWLADKGVPFVTFGRPWDALDSHPWVDVDGGAGTAQATRHLLDAGHRRIGYIGWPEGSGVGDDRRSGWQDTMRKAGLDPTGLDLAVPNGIAEGAAAAQRLLRSNRPPTAIVCCSDSLAVGALQYIGGAGGVEVIGFDDSPVAQAIGLSSVAQPFAEAASACVRLLATVLDGPASTRHRTRRQVLLAPSLSVRSSG